MWLIYWYFVGGVDYRVTEESLLEHFSTNMHDACPQIDKECRWAKKLSCILLVCVLPFPFLISSSFISCLTKIIIFYGTWHNVLKVLMWKHNYISIFLLTAECGANQYLYNWQFSLITLCIFISYCYWYIISLLYRITNTVYTGSWQSMDLLMRSTLFKMH